MKSSPKLAALVAVAVSLVAVQAATAQDALIDKIIYAGDREELVAATRALDRTLLWNYYTVPQYFQPTMRYAIWNKFGIPDEQPHYIGIDTMSWWVLQDREAEIEDAYEDAE